MILCKPQILSLCLWMLTSLWGSRGFFSLLFFLSPSEAALPTVPPNPLFGLWVTPEFSLSVSVCSLP